MTDICILHIADQEMELMATRMYEADPNMVGVSLDHGKSGINPESGQITSESGEVVKFSEEARQLQPIFCAMTKRKGFWAHLPTGGFETSTANYRIQGTLHFPALPRPSARGLRIFTLTHGKMKLKVSQRNKKSKAYTLRRGDSFVITYVGSDSDISVSSKKEGYFNVCDMH